MRRNLRFPHLPENSTLDALAAIEMMSDGKPASLSLLNKLLSVLGTYNFICAMEILDSLGIHGSNILRLFYDKCGEDFQKFVDFIELVKTDVSTIIETRNFLKI